MKKQKPNTAYELQQQKPKVSKVGVIKIARKEKTPG